MHKEQLPAPPAVIHVPAEMVTDASRAAFRLATTQANCASEQAKREAARLLNRAANIQAALAAGRWEWLDAAGVISQATFVELLAAELDADGFGA